MRLRTRRELRFVCERCGKPQQPDPAQSTERWLVYPANARCDCGGRFQMVLEWGDGSASVIAPAPEEATP